VNRWTLPSAVATVLAVPAMLVGWNATSWASAVVRPWTAPEAAADASGLPHGAQGPAPTPEPESMPRAVELPGSSAPVPTRTVVIHNAVNKAVDNAEEAPVARHPDDVRGTDSGPEPHPDAGTVPPTDPENPATDVPRTPNGRVIPEDPGYVDEDGRRYFYDGGNGNIPPEATPSPTPSP